MGRTKQTLVAVAFTLVSCTAQVMPAATPADQVTTLRVYATTATAPLLYNLTSTYRQLNVDTVFELATGSYQTMVDKVLRDEGAYFLSHHLPDDIDSPQSRLWAAPIGQDALTMIVHPSNPVTNLTTEQLRALYQGQLERWDSVGGDARTVRVITRDAGSGLRAEFQMLVMGERETTPAAQVVPTDSAMAETVAAQSGAIGYVSLSALNPNVRALSIDGIAPNADTVYDSTYPLRTTIYIVGRAEPLDDYPALRAFIGWVQSPAGQAIVAQGYSPLLRP
jgi:phosphate transport system substrate-binding protein